MKWKDDICDYLLEGFEGFIVLVFLWGLAYIIENHPNKIEKRYGFLERDPDLRFIPCHIEPLVIWKIKPDGAFSKAGFKNRDIIISPSFFSVNAFYKSLNRPQGTIIEFKVIPWDKFKAVCDFDSVGKTEKRVVIAP